jgi:hypothetical protein
MRNADSESAAKALRLSGRKCIFEAVQDFDFAISPCMVPAIARASRFRLVGRPISVLRFRRNPLMGLNADIGGFVANVLSTLTEV